MSTTTPAVTYLVGDSGRIVCDRPKGCAGATLTAAREAHPHARAWRGLNGEPYQAMTETGAAEIRAITGGAVCDCEYTR